MTTPNVSPQLNDPAALPVPGELTMVRPIVAPPPPPPPPVPVPGRWLMNGSAGPLQFRLLRDVLPGYALSADALPSTWPLLPYASHAGWHLLGLCERDGHWSGGGMLSVPVGPGLAGVGTIPAYRRLLELGWDPELPALASTRRLLFRLLAEDDDPSFLAELRPDGDDEDLVRRGRLLLREAAAAALAQAGFESDPRLRGAARRLVERVHTFLKSPLAQKPWIRVGNQHVLPPEVVPPSFHLLVMLGFMPQFRSEQAEFMDRLFTWLTQPWPRQVVIQQIGERQIEQSHFAMGDFLATRTALDGDLPSALAWLEAMARIGFLTRHDGWVRLLDRMLDDRDRRAVWTPPRSVAMPATVPAWSWPVLPLTSPAWADDPAAALSADVSFRLALIAGLAGRTLEVI